MSDDLISRQAAIEAYLETVEPIAVQEWDGEISACARDRDILEMLENLPSVQLKTGQWKETLFRRDDEGDILRDYECTNCLGIICDVPDDDEKELPRFCCMCGAKMEGGTE